MKIAPIPHNESKRLHAVHSLGIDPHNSEERFDRITHIAHLVFNVRCTVLTLVTENRILSISKQGSASDDEPRDISFCGHTIGNNVTNAVESRIFEIKDALEDMRFHDNPYVEGISSIRYYIGFVLQSLDKKNVGTLCMIDTRPRHLTSVEKNIFIELGLIAESEINHNASAIKNELKIKKIVESIEGEDDVYGYVERLCAVSDAANELLEIMDKHLTTRGINLKEWRILNEIMQNENVTPSFVSVKTNISPSIISRLLESLESKKLIERLYLNRTDRRKVSLNCTTNGKSLWLYGKSYAVTLQDSIARVSKTIFN